MNEIDRRGKGGGAKNRSLRKTPILLDINMTLIQLHLILDL